MHWVRGCETGNTSAMTLRRTFAGVLSVALTLALVACGDGRAREELLYPQDAAYQESVGKQVELKFVALDGREIDIAQFRGKVVLLDFWATWCGPCMQKLPELKDVYRRFNPLGLEIIGISSDFEKAQLQGAVAQQQLTWPQYFDGKGKENDLVKRFGITHYPSMWLIDQKGIVRYISAGSNLEGKIGRLLREGMESQGVSQVGEKGWVAKILGPLTPGGGEAAAVDPVGAATEVAADATRFIDVKNITITARRQTAIVKTDSGIHHLVSGGDLMVHTKSGPVKLTCHEITKDAVIFEVAGQARQIKVNFQ